MPVTRISPKEALALVESEGYAYLDVRSVGEYEQGHPAGSFNVPLAQPGPGGMAPNADFLAVVKAKFALDAPLVVGCQAGGRSLRACGMLQEAGFTRVVDQRAGFGGARNAFGSVEEPGWQAAGLPVAAGPDAERGYAKLSQAKR